MKTLIEFYGPASSGKTTMMYSIASKLSMEGLQVVTLEESIRQLKFDIAAELSRDNGRSMQFSILQKQVENITQKLSEADIVICDRSIYDFIIYVGIYMGKGEFYDVYKAFVPAIYTALGVENHYIFELTSVGFENDGLRHSPNYAFECTEFRNGASDYTHAIKIAVPTTNHDERIKIIMENLKC